MKRLALILLAALLLAACGSSDDTTTTQAATTTDGEAMEAVTVNVTANEYAFESDLTTFEAGVPYHFVVTNTGEEEHEFMIIAPIEPGSMDMEAMDDLALVVIEDEDLQAGAVATADFTFTAEDVGADLEFACHVGEHYEDGMHIPITVSG